MPELRSSPPPERPASGPLHDRPAVVPPLVARASTPPQLLAALTAADPGRPRITWYDDAPGPTQGERIELSARVLANWTAKAANLLVDELDVEPGDVVALDLPPHWRTVYWALAGWSAAAEVALGPVAGARVAVTCDASVLPDAATSSDHAARCEQAVAPDEAVRSDQAALSDQAVSPERAVASGADRRVVVTLAALARGWAGPPLAADQVDEALEVAQQPDAFVPAEDFSGAAVLQAARQEASAQGWPPGARVLVSVGSAGVALLQVLAALSVDGSVVLVRDAPAGSSPEAARSRAEAERVTHRA